MPSDFRKITPPHSAGTAPTRAGTAPTHSATLRKMITYMHVGSRLMFNRLAQRRGILTVLFVRTALVVVVALAITLALRALLRARRK